MDAQIKICNQFHQAILEEDKEKILMLVGSVDWECFLSSQSVIVSLIARNTCGSLNLFRELLPIFVKNGYNPLHDTSMYYFLNPENSEIMSLMYDVCARQNLTTKNENTLVHVVTFAGDVTAASEALKCFAQSDMVKQNSAGETPLHLYMSSLSRNMLIKLPKTIIEEASLLTSLGSDWNTQDHQGKTPLSLLEESSKEFSIKSLFHDNFIALESGLRAMISKQDLEKKMKQNKEDKPAPAPKKM